MAATRQLVERIELNFAIRNSDQDAQADLSEAIKETLLELVDGQEQAPGPGPAKKRGGPRGPRKKKAVEAGLDPGD